MFVLPRSIAILLILFTLGAGCAPLSPRDVADNVSSSVPIPGATIKRITLGTTYEQDVRPTTLANAARIVVPLVHSGLTVLGDQRLGVRGWPRRCPASRTGSGSCCRTGAWRPPGGSARAPAGTTARRSRRRTSSSACRSGGTGRCPAFNSPGLRLDRGGAGPGPADPDHHLEGAVHRRRRRAGRGRWPAPPQASAGGGLSERQGEPPGPPLLDLGVRRGGALPGARVDPGRSACCSRRMTTSCLGRPRIDQIEVKVHSRCQHPDGEPAWPARWTSPTTSGPSTSGSSCGTNGAGAPCVFNFGDDVWIRLVPAVRRSPSGRRRRPPGAARAGPRHRPPGDRGHAGGGHVARAAQLLEPEPGGVPRHRGCRPAVRLRPATGRPDAGGRGYRKGSGWDLPRRGEPAAGAGGPQRAAGCRRAKPAVAIADYWQRLGVDATAVRLAPQQIQDLSSTIGHVPRLLRSGAPERRRRAAPSSTAR